MTLMFKSSPRLSKQVDYLLNLVGIYLRVYIFYKDCVTHISSVEQWCHRPNLVQVSQVQTPVISFFSTVLEIMNNLTAVK